MKSVLTVDDSKSMRTIISKALTGLDLELRQAEDGQQGLAEVARAEPDLILLDLTMPVMDGPTMLKQLRERGKKTRVILLTAESGSSVIGPLVPLGFDDYIIKPFKAEELQSKVNRILFPSNKAAPSGAPGQEKVATDKNPSSAGAQSASDVLLVDDMENVAKQFRSLMPEKLKVDYAADVPTSMSLCRGHSYKVVLLDLDIPDVDTASLVRQLRILQPKSLFIGLVMRNVKNPAQLVKERGLESALAKPFDPDQIADFLSSHFESEDLVEMKENVLTFLPFHGNKEREGRYFARAGKLVNESIEKGAAACYPFLVMDVSKLPRSDTELLQMVSGSATYAATMGLQLRIATSPEIKAILERLVETASLPMYPSIQDAVQDSNRLVVKMRK